MPSFLSGQVSITGSAQPLSATPVNSVAFTVKAPSTNANPVYIGGSGVTTATGHMLEAGDEFEFQFNDQHGQPPYQVRVSDTYVIGTAGTDKVTWLASPNP